MEDIYFSEAPAIFNFCSNPSPNSTSFPALRWRSFVTKRLHMLFGFSPSLVRPCVGSAKVGVYYRSSAVYSSNLRRICNLNAVLAGLDDLLGSANVAPFTTNESLSLLEQINLFEDHDILLGPHGSHWAISWFAERPRVIIEAQAVVGAFDLRPLMVTKGDGHLLLVSAGHIPYREDCSGPDAVAAEQARRLCAPENFDGTSLLCDGAGALAPCGTVLRCRSSEGQEKQMQRVSLEINVTAMLEHTARAVGFLDLQSCSQQSGNDRLA